MSIRELRTKGRYIAAWMGISSTGRFGCEEAFLRVRKNFFYKI